MKTSLLLTVFALLLISFACISHAQVDSALLTPALLKVMLKYSMQTTLMDNVDCSACDDCCKAINMFTSAEEMSYLVKSCFLAEHMDWTCVKTECPVQFRKRMMIESQFKDFVELFKNSIENVDNAHENDIRKLIKDEIELTINEISGKSLLQKIDALLATSKVLPKITSKATLPNCRPWMGENCKPPQPHCKPWMGPCDQISAKVSTKVLPKITSKVTLPNCRPWMGENCKPPQPHCKPWMSEEECNQTMKMISSDQVKENPIAKMFPCSPWMSSDMCESLRKKYAGCPYHTFSECDFWLQHDKH